MGKVKDYICDNALCIGSHTGAGNLVTVAFCVMTLCGDLLNLGCDLMPFLPELPRTTGQMDGHCVLPGDNMETCTCLELESGSI